MRHRFGVGILGAYIRFGLFDRTGKLLEKWQVTFPGFKDSSQIIPSIVNEAERYLARKGVLRMT